MAKRTARPNTYDVTLVRWRDAGAGVREQALMRQAAWARTWSSTTKAMKSRLSTNTVVGPLYRAAKGE